MYSLPFDDGEFDTIILDDVLPGADSPTGVIEEALRLLTAGGRVLLLATIGAEGAEHTRKQFTDWAAQTGLRLAPPRSIPDKKPGWMLGVATL
jgi:ubiquinone/menaquinone biosynthesis C-methylase UbiE